MGHICSRCGALHTTVIPISIGLGFQVFPAKVGAPAVLQIHLLLWSWRINLGRSPAPFQDS
jgi:hypothetical protein